MVLEVPKCPTASFLAAACILSLAPSGFAETLDVPNTFPTIQDAIDAASPGDEVLVAPGRYLETIDFSGKAILVRAETNPRETIIDGGGQPAYVVRFATGEGSGSVLDGFTITGGSAGTSGPAGVGGGILVQGTAPVLANLIVTANSGLQGGGLRVVNGAPLVLGTTFSANQANTGGGLYASQSDSELVDVRFIDNGAGYGGGGLWAGGGTLRVEDAEFTGNTVGSFGGGLLLNTVQVDLTDLWVEGNGEAEFLPDGVVIFGTFGGGGLYSTGASGRIDRSAFVDNLAAAGGGLYIAGSGSLELVNTLSANNRAGIAGGGIYTNASSPTLIHCTIARNYPGGLFSTFVSFPTVRNSVLADNGNAILTHVDVYGNGSADLSWSVVGDPVIGGGTLGPGAFVADARLTDDYRLAADSPAIDAADNTAVPLGVNLDLAGAPRFVDDPATLDTGIGPAPIADMGAFERAAPGLAPHGFAPHGARRPPANRPR